MANQIVDDYYIKNRKRMFDELSEKDKASMMKEFEMPSVDEMMKLIDSFHGVTEEDKAKLRANILKRIAYGEIIPGGGGGGRDSISDFDDDGGRSSILKSLSDAATADKFIYEPTFHEIIVFYIMVALIVFVFVFIGYKLYKSLTDKNRKREEKQKAKQSKKKK